MDVSNKTTLLSDLSTKAGKQVISGNKEFVPVADLQGLDIWGSLQTRNGSSAKTPNLIFVLYYKTLEQEQSKFSYCFSNTLTNTYTLEKDNITYIKF